MTGFDVFIINRIVLPATPVRHGGRTWWDYWVPWRFHWNPASPSNFVNEPIFLHHRHPGAIRPKEWERMTEHFAWVEGHPVGKVMTGRSPNDHE